MLKEKDIGPSFIHFWLHNKISLEAIFENIWLQKRIRKIFKYVAKVINIW